LTSENDVSGKDNLPALDPGGDIDDTARLAQRVGANTPSRRLTCDVLSQPTL
jgi:hypothetical protein